MQKNKNGTAHDNVYGFKTKHSVGFTFGEIKELLSAHYENIDYMDFCNKLGVITCIVIDGDTVIYFRDVFLAITLCIENRDAYYYEWD